MPLPLALFASSYNEDDESGTTLNQNSKASYIPSKNNKNNYMLDGNGNGNGNNINDKPKNKNTKHNPYQENGLKVVRNKEKIVASIFKYTVVNIPKLIVPFVEYHSFYIPLSNWNPIEYRFHPSITLVKIGTQNINIFIDFLHSQHYNNHYRLFDAFIVPSIPHIMHLVKCEIYSIYILLQKNNAVTIIVVIVVIFALIIAPIIVLITYTRYPYIINWRCFK